MTPLMIRSIVVGIAILGAAMPLHAQMMATDSSTSTPPAARTIAEVRTDGGEVMISDGGPFETAVQGQRVDTNSRVMVSRDSSATVIYDNGCREKHDNPGIYNVTENCVLAPPAVAATAAAPGSGAPLALIGVGAAVALYAIVDSFDDDDDDQLPVSR